MGGRSTPKTQPSALSMEPPKVAKAMTQRGHYDHGGPVSLWVEAEMGTGQSRGQSLDVSGDVKVLDDGVLMMSTFDASGFDEAGASSYNSVSSKHVGGFDEHHTQGNGQGGQQLSGERHKNQVVQSNAEEDDRLLKGKLGEFTLDFEEDMDLILGDQRKVQGLPKKPSVPAAQSGGLSVPTARPKLQEPKGHSLFDKMAQGMEYATTFDVGTVSMSSVFDQFDTAMEVEEMTRKPLPLQGGGTADMAEMFSQFDRAAEPEPLAFSKSEEDVAVTRDPVWRPQNALISGYDELVRRFPGCLYLLEQCDLLMDRVLLAFEGGAYSWIPLHFEVYRSNDPRSGAGFGIIQVRVNGEWRNLYSYDQSLEGLKLSWENDFRLVVGMNYHAVKGQDSVGARICTLVHELGLHTLQNAELLNVYRKHAGRTPEQLRQEYQKSVLLELHHHQIMGVRQPKNLLYEAIQEEVLKLLKAKNNWLEEGEVRLSLLSDYPELIKGAPSDFAHLQKKGLVAVWYQYLIAVTYERTKNYNPDAFFNLLGSDFKGVDQQMLDALMQGSLEAVKAFCNDRSAVLPPTVNPSTRQ